MATFADLQFAAMLQSHFTFAMTGSTVVHHVGMQTLGRGLDTPPADLDIVLYTEVEPAVHRISQMARANGYEYEATTRTILTEGRKVMDLILLPPLRTSRQHTAFQSQTQPLEIGDAGMVFTVYTPAHLLRLYAHDYRRAENETKNDSAKIALLTDAVEEETENETDTLASPVAAARRLW
jgi:hypothetical protein